MRRIYIIAEAGVNHNGDLGIAKKMIAAARCAGADAVKFQTFRADAIATASAPKAEYQKKHTLKNQTQRQMLKALELTAQDHRILLRACKEEGIEFLSTPFDEASVDLLSDLGLKTFKVASCDLTHKPLLRRIGHAAKRVILSTGMATLKEVKEAVQVLTASGVHKKNITLMHCNTAYPTPYEDANLRAMMTLGKKFSMAVGYSDHTEGIEVALAAAALGASVIEKHFTLNRKMAGPDHKASIEPGELKALCQMVRHIEQAIGDGKKGPSRSEQKNIRIARRCIVAARDIYKGETFSPENMAVKRPDVGISPMRWDDVIGKKARTNFIKDQPLEI